MLTMLREIWAFVAAVLERMDKIHMGLIAAGVAFYAMFAVFPGLAAIIALWSLWFDPNVITAYLDVAHEFLPDGAADLIDAQIMSLTSAGSTSVGWASFVSFMVATIAARAGVEAVVGGLNAAYGVRSHSTVFGFVLAYGLTRLLSLDEPLAIGLIVLGLILALAFNEQQVGPLEVLFGAPHPARR